MWECDLITEVRKRIYNIVLNALILYECLAYIPFLLLNSFLACSLAPAIALIHRHDRVWYDGVCVYVYVHLHANQNILIKCFFIFILTFYMFFSGSLVCGNEE